jgi:vacuolar-type H+-ATPase subunit C/Vma6
MEAKSAPKVRPSCVVPLEFLNAKVRGRRSQLYEGPRLQQLSRERTIGDLSRRLYPNEGIPDPLSLERRLLRGCVGDLSFLGFFLGEPYQAFYSALLDRYPVENLKVLLRLFTQEPESVGPGSRPAEKREAQEAIADELLLDLPRGPSLPARELLRSAQVDEFVARIPLWTVRACAKKALPLYHEGRRRAYLEMAFDQGYWLSVWESLARLPAGERRECSAPLQCEFDAMRLLGTLRAAGTYGLPWDEWESVLPAGQGGISTSTLRSIHARPDLEHVGRAVRWAKAALDRYLRPEDAPDLGRLEEVLWRETVSLANRQHYASVSASAALVSYFYLKREELRRLLGLTQMLRYGKAENEVSAYLEQ